MSLINSYQTVCASEEQTEALAQKLGNNLKGGEVIELISDLGGGKTTFVRGLARGMGSTDHVASPTFTISKVYKNSQQELHHFDFYRLAEVGLIKYELEEVIGVPSCIVVIEWAQAVRQILPSTRLTIKIKKTGWQSRQLNFRYPPSLGYLLKGVKAANLNN